MKKNKAFTLIELLVVIAIISLLLAIVMPTFRKVKAVAYKVMCKNNQHQFGLAMGTYEADMGTNFRNHLRYDVVNNPDRYWFYSNGTADYAHEFQPNVVRDIMQSNFLPDYKVLFCPGIRGLAYDRNYELTEAMAGTVNKMPTSNIIANGDTPVFWGTLVWVWRKETTATRTGGWNGTTSINPSTSNALMCDMTDGAWDFVKDPAQTPDLADFFQTAILERPFQHNNILLADYSVDNSGDNDEDILEYLWASDKWAGIGY